MIYSRRGEGHHLFLLTEVYYGLQGPPVLEGPTLGEDTFFFRFTLYLYG